MNPTTKSKISTNHETFISLVALIASKRKFHKEVVHILSYSSFDRISRLNTFIEHLKLQGVKVEYLELFLALKEDQIATRTLKYLKDRESEQFTREDFFKAMRFIFYCTAYIPVIGISFGVISIIWSKLNSRRNDYMFKNGISSDVAPNFGRFLNRVN